MIINFYYHWEQLLNITKFLFAADSMTFAASIIFAAENINVYAEEVKQCLLRKPYFSEESTKTQIHLLAKEIVKIIFQD